MIMTGIFENIKSTKLTLKMAIYEDKCKEDFNQKN